MIQIFEQIIPKEVCELLIGEGLNRPQLNAGIGENNLMSEGRSTKISFIGNQAVKNYIQELVTSKYKNYVITEAEDLQFATYNVGDFYGPHYDADEKNKRILSISVQLSNPLDYEGGDLCLYGIGGSPSPTANEQGTMVIFPSNLLHEVEPVTKGVRYSLVQWFKGYESSN
jgi:PKHD-type hydroxylase